MSTNVVSSTHSPEEDLRRSLIARPISVTAEPFEMYRSSGSRVTFPMRNTRFMLLAMAISLFLCPQNDQFLQRRIRPDAAADGLS